MESKINGKSRIKIIWALCLVFLLIQFLVEYFYGLRLLIFNLNSTVIMLIMIVNLMLSPIYFFNYNKYKMLKKIYSTLAIICLIPCILYYMLFFSGNRYFHFKDPNNNSGTLVVEELNSWYGHSNFYVRKYGVFIKSLNHSISFDNNQQGQFSTHDYQMKWIDENTIQLDYQYGGHKYNKSEIIKLD